LEPKELTAQSHLTKCGHLLFSSASRAAFGAGLEDNPRIARCIRGFEALASYCGFPAGRPKIRSCFAETDSLLHDRRPDPAPSPQQSYANSAGRTALLLPEFRTGVTRQVMFLDHFAVVGCTAGEGSPNVNRL
jgi:hypothetical protein